MDRKAVSEIHQWMQHFRRTRGLVVDVRGNGGGSREGLRSLFSYLSAPGDAPRVVNCAGYRLFDKHGVNHLANRFLYRESAGSWSDAEREAIKAFKTSFRPRWTPPRAHFSDWHYMVLTRLDHPTVFHYKSPVVVLMDSKCFSATDIFLAALKGWRNVTLLGTPSSGGSARARTVRLRGSSLSVRLGTMVSFRPDGELFDGNGVEPDVHLEPSPEYFVGGRDNVLEEARRRLTQKR
jgi:C-terminal processing protease CtpA/Prc